MTVYNIIALVISVLSISTLTGLIWKDLHDKRIANSQHIKDLKKREAQDNLREVIKEENKGLVDTVDKIKANIDIIGNGTLSALRNDILKNYYDCEKKGYRNDLDYANMHELYEAYQRMNGNSFVSEVVRKFDNLPTWEDYQKNLNK